LYYFYFVLILISFSCSNRPKPEWLNSQPQQLYYWYGIGIVNKKNLNNDCRELAKNNAISEIASQIKLELSGKFKRVITENNLNLNDFSESIFETRTENKFFDVEFVDYYDGRDKCAMLVKLSQVKYYKKIEEMRENAVKTTLGLLEEAESEFSYQTFSYLNDAINEIFPYVDFPIEVEYPSGTGEIINIYRYIKVQSSKYLNRINLVPDSENIEINLVNISKESFNVRALDKKNGSILYNIPVLSYLNNDEKSKTVFSNQLGNSAFSFSQIENKSIQYINFELSAEIMTNYSLIGEFPKINSQITMNVIPPKIYIFIKENNLGEESENPYINSAFSEYLNKYFSAKFVDQNKAEILIKGVANTRAISLEPNNYGIYQVFGDATISIINNQTGEEIISKSYNKIQGSDFHSNFEAGKQSLKKISKQIEEDFFSQFIEYLK